MKDLKKLMLALNVPTPGLTLCEGVWLIQMGRITSEVWDYCAFIDSQHAKDIPDQVADNWTGAEQSMYRVFPGN